MSTPDDDVTLTVGGAALAGWTSVKITRRIEACPNDFELEVTDSFPGQADAVVVQAGQSCVVAIGGDTVITGYVDRVSRGYSAEGHTVSVAGRGKTQDLVDCDAEYPTGQIGNATIQQIADLLCQPYGIETVLEGSDDGPMIPQFNLTLGEKAYDIIERIARYAGFLVYENVDGDLIITRAQDARMASGFREGVNVQTARVLTAMNERFSEYRCFLLSMDVLSDAGQGGNLFATVKDPNVLRHRLSYLIAEAGGGGQQICQQRAQWEAARRIARGQQAQVTVDSWRASDGTLWTPNLRAPLHLPNLKLDDKVWTIGEVTYLKDAQGTRAEVSLADKAAYLPQPILLQPQFMDVVPAPPA